MRHWAQFYTLREGAYHEALGSDQVFNMDGRWSRRTMERKAAEWCARRGFAGWRLARGESYSRPFYLTAAVRAL